MNYYHWLGAEAEDYLVECRSLRDIADTLVAAWMLGRMA